MAKQSQKVAELEMQTLYAVYHFTDLKEKRRAEEYFKKIGVEIAHYFLSISNEPGECEPTRFHSVFIRNPLLLESKLLKVGNEFLVRNMQVMEECGPREISWNHPTTTWVNMACTVRKK